MDVRASSALGDNLGTLTLPSIARNLMTEKDLDRLVVSYLGEDHYHRSDEDDDMRPACHPERIRGVVAIRTEAERRGQTPCPDCWPSTAE